MNDFSKKWDEVGPDYPRPGSFSSTHWIHGVGGEAPFSQHEMLCDMEGISKSENPAMSWGLLLEPLMGERALKKISTRLEMDFELRDCPTRATSFGGAMFRDTCDFLLTMPGWTQRYGLEIKTSASFNQRRLWGQEWTAEVPEHVAMQCQAHMAANGLDQCFIGLWNYSPAEPRIYIVDRDDELITRAMNGLADWWQKHIERKEALIIDGSDGCTRFYQRIDALEPEILDGCNQEDRGLMLQYAEAKRDSKAADEKLSEAKNLLRERIGPAGGISFGDDGSVKWSTGKTRRFSDTLSVEI